MAPSTSPALVTTTRTNDAEYYCFDVKKRRDDVGKQLIVPLNCSVNFNLKKLREMLYFEFGMNEDSPIFYIDDDGDEIPISSECEFLEALKFARTFTVHKGVPLLVESMHASHEHEGTAVSEINRHVSSKTLRDAQNMENTTQDCSTDLNNMTFMMKDVASKMSEKLEDAASKEPDVSTQWNSPPSWFLDYMESMKKDMLHATSELKHMVETLNKRLDYLAPLPCNECCQCQPHPCFPKRHSNPHAKQTNEKRMNTQEEGQSTDTSMERTNAKDRQLRQEKLNLHHELDRIKGEIRVLMKDKYHRFDGMTDPNLGTAKGQEQPTQNNNVREDFAPPSCCMSSKVDLHDLKALDGELRMNCSITGNQMLYLDCLEDTCDNLMEDIDKVSLCSGCFNATEDREQEDAFVMIDMPTLGSADRLLTDSKVFAEHRQRDSSRDSPSFELLSETPSPRSSLYIDEEHFSNSFPAFENGGNPPSSQETNVQRIYVVDVHGKIYNSSTNAGECANTDLEKRTDGVYSFVAETLPVQDTGLSRSSYVVSNERNGSQDNAAILNDDARSSLTSYLSVESDHARQPEETSSYLRMHSQSQTDSGDFMQSFHSHTTSVTDNGDVFAESYSSLAEQARHDRNQMTVMETRRMAAAATMTTTSSTMTTATSATSSSSQRKPARHVRERKYSGADKTRCDDANKRFRLHHPSREKSSNESVDGSRRTSGEQTSADPVHILPETLVTVAAHVGSVAYVTARDVFHKLDKLRSHTRDDPFKRPRVRLNATAEGPSSSACRSSNES